MNVNLIIDSTTDLRPELRERFTVVPLTVHFGEEAYRDGEAYRDEGACRDEEAYQACRGVEAWAYRV